MPGRTSTRSVRSSGASARKPGAKTRGSTSTRTSAHAVEIPDEGEDNPLRAQICQIFSDAQNTTATQRKLQTTLRKIQERCYYEPQSTNKRKAQQEEDECFDEEHFSEEITRCILRVLAVKKGEPVGDRVIRFLGLFLKHASEKDRVIYQNEPDGIPETATSRLISHILQTLRGFFTAKEKTLRFRATQMAAHIVSNLEVIDDDLFSLMKVSFKNRLRDKEASVRVQAVLGLGRLVDATEENEDEEDEDDEDPTVGILEKLTNILQHDPSAEVRRVVLSNLGRNEHTGKYIFERAKDIDPSVRRVVYRKVLPGLGDFRYMTLVQREKLLRWGLRDRDDSIRKATARIFAERWLEDCASTYYKRPEDERKPDEWAPPNLEAITELLDRLDIVHSGAEEGIAHEAMQELWEIRFDYRNFVAFDHDFWRELSPEQAFLARSLNDYCHKLDDENLREELIEKIPEVGVFAFIVQKHLNTLIKLGEQVASLSFELSDDDPEMQKAQEAADDQDFIVQQLLYIALTLDYSDEIGRRQMYNIMRDSIARAALPEECTKLAIEILRFCCRGPQGEADFCAVILEAIAEVRDTLMDDDVTEKGEDGDEEDSFHSAQSDVISNASTESNTGARLRNARTPETTDPEEEEERRNREVLVYAKCLYITQCTLENVHCDLQSNTSLTTMLNTLIIPAVRGTESMIRERGVVCLGLGALLSRDLAASNLDLFLHCFNKGHDQLKEIVIQVLADIVVTHPSLLAPPIPDPNTSTEEVEPQLNALVKPLTRMVLKGFQSDNKGISLMACMAASKLVLPGLLPPAAAAEILKAFTVAYFDPETASHAAVRQALSYFIPMFCHSKLENALLMAQIAVPIVAKLMHMQEDNEEEQDEMVGWPVITAHLSDWTDGRKVVGALELGLDGKTLKNQDAEEPHICLATEILERSLTNACTKDERKPLLTLLTKLYIAPSGPAPDKEALSTLRDLVTEAVEDKIGMDATQRNYLIKLEVNLNKRVGDVEAVTQIADSGDETVTPEATEVPATASPRNEEDEEEAEAEAEEDEDTMLAGMQGESTRMPLEMELDEEEDGGRSSRAITESDIVESLLASEIDEDSV